LKITRKDNRFEIYLSLSYAQTRLTPPVCLLYYLSHQEWWG
jgi:hypothetical protein